MIDPTTVAKIGAYVAGHVITANMGIDLNARAKEEKARKEAEQAKLDAIRKPGMDYIQQCESAPRYVSESDAKKGTSLGYKISCGVIGLMIASIPMMIAPKTTALVAGVAGTAIVVKNIKK